MQKYANLVELEKCCQTHIFLQKFILIQPRTSPLKICKIFAKFAKFAKFVKFAGCGARYHGPGYRQGAVKGTLRSCASTGASACRIRRSNTRSSRSIYFCLWGTSMSGFIFVGGPSIDMPDIGSLGPLS